MQIRSGLCNLEGHTGCIRCTLVSSEDRIDESVLIALGAAFDRYPESLLRDSRIEHIALCKTLHHSHRADPVGAVDLASHRMFISVQSLLDRPHEAGSLTGEDIVHHELFHLIAYEHMDSDHDDPEWRLNNPLGFEYAAQAPNASEPTAFNGRLMLKPAARPSGFVNSYATTNEQEDRASTFEYMMARPAELCEITRQDPIVRSKVKLLWERVAAIADDDFMARRVMCAPDRAKPTSGPVSE